MLLCPFCGLATNSPHETQAACIEALHAEISRVRDIVGKRKEGDADKSPESGASSVIPPTTRRGEP